VASVKQRPDGRWRARYRDDTNKEHARHFARKVDAQRWLDEVTAAMVTGQYVDPRAGRATMTEFYAEWSSRQVWETTTTAAMSLAVRCSTFKDIPLGDVRRSHVEQWVKTLHGAGLAPSTIRTRFNNVRAVLRAAERDRLIASDPSSGVPLPRGRRATASMVLPTDEQVRAVLEASTPWFRALVALAAFAGLRLGEAAAVQVGDVDFLRRTLTVERQVQRAGKGLVELRPPKYGSERVVYLPESLVELLSAHLVQHRPGATTTAFLFEPTPGQPPHQNTVGYQWRAACTRAGVSGVTLHDLRHYFASGLVAAGCDVVTVQRALGHAKATTTLNTYAHLWPTAEDRTRAAAGGLVHAVLGAAADSSRTAGA
jgi:integrase